MGYDCCVFGDPNVAYGPGIYERREMQCSTDCAGQFPQDRRQQSASLLGLPACRVEPRFQTETLPEPIFNLPESFGKVSATQANHPQRSVPSPACPGRTVEKIAAVVEAAEREPTKFNPLLAEMDRTGKVDGAYRKLKQAQDEQPARRTSGRVPQIHVVTSVVAVKLRSRMSKDLA